MISGTLEVQVPGVQQYPRGSKYPLLIRTLVPKAILGMVLGPDSLDIGYLDPLGM